MFFRISRNTNTEIRVLNIAQVGINIFSVVHIHHLLNQLFCIAIAIVFRDKSSFTFYRISAKQQHIVNAQEMQINQRIFRVLLRESAADNVRYGIDLILIQERCANAHCSWTFTNRVLF